LSRSRGSWLRPACRCRRSYLRLSLSRALLTRSVSRLIGGCWSSGLTSLQNEDWKDMFGGPSPSAVASPSAPSSRRSTIDSSVAATSAAVQVPPGGPGTSPSAASALASSPSFSSTAAADVIRTSQPTRPSVASGPAAVAADQAAALPGAQLLLMLLACCLIDKNSLPKLVGFVPLRPRASRALYWPVPISYLPDVLYCIFFAVAEARTRAATFSFRPFVTSSD